MQADNTPQTYRILVSDAMAESGLQPLQDAADMQVDICTNLTHEQLLEIIPEYDALLVRSSTQVTSEILQAGKCLRVVGRAGVGVDNIDIDAATQAGIIVVNAPTGNTIAAAEHTIAMLMALARHIPQADAHVRNGEWKRGHFVGVEVRGKTLGSYGLGRVAQEVAHGAQGLGMTVIAHDPYVTAEYAAHCGVELVDFNTLIEQADFLTIHVPLTPETYHKIGQPQLSRMKSGTRILNVARGGVINEQALAEAIESGHIAGVALDVFENEPLPIESPLRNHDSIILTPHLGASTVEAQEQVAEDVAVQVLEILHDKPARYAVNAPIIPPNDLDFMIPYIDLAERLGSLLKQLGAQGAGDVELTAYGKLALFDLSYIKAAAIKGLLADIVQVRVNLVNANLLAEGRDMNLVERKMQHHEMRYDNMLMLSATSGEERWIVCGAIIQGAPTIVAIGDLWVNFPAKGHLLISSHQDRPGIIGLVGTILGQCDINISFMYVGRYVPRSSSAIMVLGTDEKAPSKLHDEIVAIPDIHWLKAVTL